MAVRKTFSSRRESRSHGQRRILLRRRGRESFRSVRGAHEFAVSHLQEPRAYPWYFDDFGARYRWRGEGEIALEKDLTTDADGKATLSLETAAFGTEDVEFTIEARMTDASRREIIGSGNIRVTKLSYQVYARAKHSLHRPNDKAEIEFHAFDANDQGVSAEGKVKVTRDFWYEVWEDAAGREIKGNELKAAESRAEFPAARVETKISRL